MKTTRPPGPRDLFFGMSLMRRMQQDYLGFWREQQRRYGDTVYMRLWNYGHYTFFHPEQIREVLVEKAASFVRFEHPMRVFAQLQGQSLLVTAGRGGRGGRRQHAVRPGGAIRPRRSGRARSSSAM
jgi:cytochrome P450